MRRIAWVMCGSLLVACSGAENAADDLDGSIDGSSDAGLDGRADDATLFDAIDDASDDARDAHADADDADAGYPFPTPIRYVVVIVKENHTFDNLFTGFPGVDAPPATVKLKDGRTITRKPAAFKGLAGDMSHSHASGVADYNGGKMNGWSDTIPDSYIDQPFTYYPEAQIPSYWAYARNFVLFDNFFSSHMGPSSPGHFGVHTAVNIHYENPTGTGNCYDLKSTGTVGTFDPDTCATKNMFPCFDVPAIEEMIPAPLTWRAYPGSHLDQIKGIGGNAALRKAHYRSMSNLLADLDKDDLANLTTLNISGGTYDGEPASEHPPSHPCNGENYTVEIVNRLMKSKHWHEMAIVFTYDDFGGWYDHVAPKVEKCPSGAFFHTGFRLPAMIISPYAKKGFLDHTKSEHASIPRLIEDLFGLPRMKANPKAPWNKYVPRDATAGSMMGAFDFTQPPRGPLMRTLRTDCPPP